MSLALNEEALTLLFVGRLLVAVDLAEELYIQLRNELANGKTLFLKL